jgi:hypothetical protein
MNVNGIITNIRKESKTGKATGKPFTIQYVSVDTLPGVEINMGWTKGLSSGQPFVGVIEQNQYGQWAPVTGGTTGTTVGTPAPTAAPQRKSGGMMAGVAYPVPATDPQNIIINQNALSHATEVVGHFMNQYDSTPGAPATFTLEMVTEMVLQVAPRMAAYSSGRLTLEAYEALKKQGSMPVPSADDHNND